MSSNNDISSEDQNPQPALGRYLEPASLLTLTIGAVYYLGWVYINGYFTRIGINHLSLELPTSYYLKQGYIAVMAAWYLSQNLFLINKGPVPTRKEAFWQNFPFIIAALFLFNPYPIIRNTDWYFSIFFISLIIIVFTLLIYYKKSLIYEMSPPTTIARISLAVLLFGLLSFHALQSGERAGKRAVEGGNIDTSAITIIWKEPQPQELDNKPLILILHNGGKYYVVEKTIPALEKPQVYVIPDEAVKYVITSPVN